MPRKKHPISTHCPYHVSARCLNREWFGMELQSLWPLMTDYLYFIQQAYGIRILSFVLMNNHFHLLVKSPNGNLSAAMNYFMRETSRSIAKHTKRINHVYGGRYHRTLIEDDHYYLCAYKYVYRNPVEAGICDRPEDYPYSSLRGLLGYAHLPVPIDEDCTLFDSGVEETLRWLNRQPLESNRDDVAAALKKKTFKLRKTNHKNEKHPLENQMY